MSAVNRRTQISVEDGSGNDPDAREIRLFDIVSRLWRNGKKAFAICVGGGLLLGILATHVIPRKYAIDMAIMPVQTDDNSNSLTSRVAQLALGASNEPATYEAFQLLLTSEEVASRLQRRYAVMQRIFATQWDAEHRHWREPGGMWDYVTNVIKVIFGFPAWHPPTTVDLAHYLSEHLSVSSEGQQDIKHLGIVVKDPQFGVFLLNAVHNEADNIIKERKRVRAEAQINYLKKELAIVTVAEHRQALTTLLVENERTLMLINPDTPLAAEIVESPVIPPVPNSPQPLLILLLCVGAGLGLFFVLAALGVLPER